MGLRRGDHSGVNNHRNMGGSARCHDGQSVFVDGLNTAIARGGACSRRGGVWGID